MFAMIERALTLRSAIDEFVAQQIEKWHEYEARFGQLNGRKGRQPRKKQPPAILVDQLSVGDWETLRCYYRILKPVAKTTLELQGRVGQRGQIWRVLPIMEQLLTHFENAKEVFPRSEADMGTAIQSEPSFHFRANINLAWQKKGQVSQPDRDLTCLSRCRCTSSALQLALGRGALGPLR